MSNSRPYDCCRPQEWLFARVFALTSIDFGPNFDVTQKLYDSSINEWSAFCVHFQHFMKFAINWM